MSTETTKPLTFNESFVNLLKLIARHTAVRVFKATDKQAESFSFNVVQPTSAMMEVAIAFVNDNHNGSKDYPASKPVTIDHPVSGASTLCEVRVIQAGIDWVGSGKSARKADYDSIQIRKCFEFPQEMKEISIAGSLPA